MTFSELHPHGDKLENIVSLHVPVEKRSVLRTIRKRSSWLASSFSLERPNTRRMSKSIFTAKQFDFLTKTGVLFAQLLILSQKLLFAQSLHCL